VKKSVIFSEDEEEDEDGDSDGEGKGKGKQPQKKRLQKGKGNAKHVGKDSDENEDEAERSLRTMMDVDDGALSGYFHSLAHSIASVNKNINVHTLHCSRPSHPRTAQPAIHHQPILSVRLSASWWCW
jgi:hypothetical protein